MTALNRVHTGIETQRNARQRKAHSAPLGAVRYLALRCGAAFSVKCEHNFCLCLGIVLNLLPGPSSSGLGLTFRFVYVSLIITVVPEIIC